MATLRIRNKIWHSNKTEISWNVEENSFYANETLYLHLQMQSKVAKNKLLL